MSKANEPLLIFEHTQFGFVVKVNERKLFAAMAMQGMITGREAATDGAEPWPPRTAPSLQRRSPGLFY